MSLATVEQKDVTPALPEYHQSGINMFLKCGRSYMYRYMMGLRIPPKSALTLGNAVDAGATFNLQQKIETKTDLPVQDVLDAYSTDFDRRTPETDWDGDNPGKQKDLGAKMLKVYHAHAAPGIKPVAVQEGFRVEFADKGYAIGGTLDVREDDDVIRDTKTSKGEYDVEAVSQEIQPAIYSFAHQAKTGRVPDFVYDVVTKHKEPRYQQVRGRVSEAQTERTFETINIMHEQIKRGEFQYAPAGAWWCSKQWCGFWHMCKGKK